MGWLKQLPLIVEWRYAVKGFEKLKGELETLKDKIQKIDPAITDELLDLMYQYFEKRYLVNCNTQISQLRDSTEFRSQIQSLTFSSTK